MADTAVNPMRITVRPLERAAEELEVNWSDTIAQVKDRLQERMAVSPFQMTLVMGRRSLRDDLATLEDLDIDDGAILTLILKTFPPPTIKDPEKIADLVKENDVEGLREAALAGYDLNVIADGGGYRTLHMAIYQNNFEMMKLVLETGVSVFSLTGPGYPKTALQVAAKYGQRDICEFLVRYGLDPREVNTMTSDMSQRKIESWSAITYAKSHGHHELVAWFEEQQAPTTAYSEIEA